PAYPDFLAIGWMDGPDAASESIFRSLASRNALNFHAARSACGVVFADQAEGPIRASVQKWLDELKAGRRIPAAALPEVQHGSLGGPPIRRALLLVGSPRTRKSTSNSLGSYLFEQLGTQSIRTETIYIHTALGSPERTRAMLEAVEAADLVVLAFPLYVDSLPSPVMDALERIASQRACRDRTAPAQLWAAISNCGFPEPDHNATALAICANFARLKGFQWAGSLALGAGQGMVHGIPLNEMDGRAIPLKKALDLAAASLRHGAAIPPEAQALLARPFIPAWLYRAMGVYGWRQQAKEYGAAGKMRDRPYLGTRA
ncbi:MAG TPA: NAD(P)H-dependent oxidoreductase, partial [Anaerolineales bacterium]|nr:NAD(P)H-dependent oxidoreductase [Anaerolineales bacterium]